MTVCEKCKEKALNPQILYDILDEQEAIRQKKSDKEISLLKWFGAAGLLFATLCCVYGYLMKYLFGEFTYPDLLLMGFFMIASLGGTAKVQKIKGT